MENKKGRKPVVITNNIIYSEILFAIANEKNYNQILAKELNKKPATVVEQLNTLEENNFLKSERIKTLNKKLYKVNWGKINEEFIEFFLKKVIEENNKTQKILSKKRVTSGLEDAYNIFMGKTEESKFFNKRNLTNNKILKILFRKIFKTYSSEKIKYSLNEIFENLIKALSTQALLTETWWDKKLSQEKIKKLAKKTDFKNINALQFIASALINFNTISEEIFYIEDEIIKEYA